MDAVEVREICQAAQVPVIEVSEACPSTLAEVSRTDPTIVLAVDQLRGCGALFERYLKLNGVEAFVRAAYVYILGRPVDSDGLQTYVPLLTSGELSAYGVLNALQDSDEFRAARRLLGAPTEPGFVFATA